MKMKIKIEFLPMFNYIVPPVYATDGSSGFDLVAVAFRQWYKAEDPGSSDREQKSCTFNTTSIILTPRSRVLVGCGFKLSIPKGYEMQTRPRSGIALKSGIMLANGTGTIDSDYRGEIGVILLNTSAFGVKISLGDRVAQGIIAPSIKAQFEKVSSLSETVRAGGGYGSTDKIFNKSLYGETEDFPNGKQG